MPKPKNATDTHECLPTIVQDPRHINEFSAFAGPTDVTDALARVAGAENRHDGTYSIACNATVPSLFLTLNGERFEVPGSELVRPLQAKYTHSCIFNVFGSDFPANFYRVGAALAREYCLVFDYVNVQLGFSGTCTARPLAAKNYFVSWPYSET